MLSKYLVVVSLLAVPVAAYAQGILGGVTGSVIDSSGAPIPDVLIRLTNTATNVTAEAQSSDAGFLFRALQPGTYRLEAEKPGFRKTVRERGHDGGFRTPPA